MRNSVWGLFTFKNRKDQWSVHKVLDSNIWELLLFSINLKLKYVNLTVDLCQSDNYVEVKVNVVKIKSSTEVLNLLAFWVNRIFLI